MPDVIRSTLRDDAGATVIEYGLIAGLVAAVIITAVSLVGTNVGALFEGIAAGFTAS